MNKILAFAFAFDGAHTSANHARAKAFIHATRKHQPEARLVQLADDKTLDLEGVDECVRVKRQSYAQWYFDIMERFPYPEFLRIEYDVIVRHDPWEVFKHDFDIAIAKEHKGMMNNGVMFVRKKAFFTELREVYLARTKRDNWNDIQAATQMVIDDGKFRVRKLDPRLYNVMPERRGDYLPQARLLHFEGPVRKDWMIADFGAAA